VIAGTERIGQLAAELMEAIEGEEMPEGFVNGRVGTVALVVELEGDNEDGEGHGVNSVKYRCSDTREWVQAGLLTVASDAARNWGVKDE